MMYPSGVKYPPVKSAHAHPCGTQAGAYSPAYTPGGLQCSHDNMGPVFNIGPSRVIAGGGRDALPELENPPVALSLAQAKVTSVVRVEAAARDRLPSLGSYVHENIPHVFIDWPDMSVPALPPAFWRALHKDLLANPTDLLVFCVGGHGRTGTALAILALLEHQREPWIPEAFREELSGQPSVDVVTFLRERYCRRAVETDSQFEYISRVTGVPLSKEIPASKGTNASRGHRRRLEKFNQSVPKELTEETRSAHSEEVWRPPRAETRSTHAGSTHAGEGISTEELREHLREDMLVSEDVPPGLADSKPQEMRVYRNAADCLDQRPRMTAKCRSMDAYRKQRRKHLAMGEIAELVDSVGLTVVIEQRTGADSYENLW